MTVKVLGSCSCPWTFCLFFSSGHTSICRFTSGLQLLQKVRPWHLSSTSPKFFEPRFVHQITRLWNLQAAIWAPPNHSCNLFPQHLVRHGYRKHCLHSLLHVLVFIWLDCMLASTTEVSTIYVILHFTCLSFLHLERQGLFTMVFLCVTDLCSWR